MCAKQNKLETAYSKKQFSVVVLTAALLRRRSLKCDAAWECEQQLYCDERGGRNGGVEMAIEVEFLYKN